MLCHLLTTQVMFRFEFTVTSTLDQVWEYFQPDHEYTVTSFGGSIIGRGEIEEPFVFSDRGAWLDG
jgi:hypothetical protein